MKLIPDCVYRVGAMAAIAGCLTFSAVGLVQAARVVPMLDNAACFIGLPVYRWAANVYMGIPAPIRRLVA